MNLFKSVNVGIEIYNITESKEKRTEYKHLKSFFHFYNYDSLVKTFDHKVYQNFQFNFLKVISNKDLTKLMSKYDCLNSSNSLKIKYEHSGVNWLEFYYTVNMIRDKNPKVPMNEILSDLQESITNKKANFKHYQKLYKEVKTSILFNSLNSLLTHSLHPDRSVIIDLKN
jgi:hypothetical protein